MGPLSPGWTRRRRGNPGLHAFGPAGQVKRALPSLAYICKTGCDPSWRPYGQVSNAAVSWIALKGVL